MNSNIVVAPQVQPRRASLSIEHLPGDSAKIFGCWVPPATLASIAEPDGRGGRHDCMKRVGKSLASQSMDADQITAVFEHMYGEDRGVGIDEMEALAGWCAENPGDPCGGPEVVARARHTIACRGTKVCISTAAMKSTRAVPPTTTAQTVENARELLGGRVLRPDELMRVSPVPISRVLRDMLASFGLLCRHLYRPEDRIVVVNRAFWPKHDFDGKWQPCGSGETCTARTWASQFTPKAVAEGCACSLPQDARLTAIEMASFSDDDARTESGIPPLEENRWWASTRWGAWFRCNPVSHYEGSGKYGAHTDRDVARYPYLLVENDRPPLETQLSIVAAFCLPVAAVTSSGRRSLHFLIAVDAANEAQFRKMAALIHARLAPMGFDHTGNPSRMTRLPGIARRDERLTPAQRQPATAKEQYSALHGFQMLLWLSKDHHGASLPW